MLNQQQQQPQPKKKFGLPAGLGKAAKLLIAAATILVIATAVALIFSGGDSSSSQVLDLMAQNQEIARVSQLQERQARRPRAHGRSGFAWLGLALDDHLLLGSVQGQRRLRTVVRRGRHRSWASVWHARGSMDGQDHRPSRGSQTAAGRPADSRGDPR